MKKVLKRIRRLFVMTKDEWTKIREKGMSSYIIRIGIIRLGLIFGPIFLFYKYLRHLNYKLYNFSIKTFLAEYFLYLPIIIIAGVIFSFFAWREHESKFFKKSDKLVEKINH